VEALAEEKAKESGLPCPEVLLQEADPSKHLQFGSEIWRLLLLLHRNHNRNLKISKALLKSQAHQGTSLFTSAATNQWGFSKGEVKTSSGPISRISGGDRVAVNCMYHYYYYYYYHYYYYYY